MEFYERVIYERVRIISCYVVGSFPVAQRDMFPKTYPAVWNELKVAGRL